jgi:sporulation protein YlmC with PRC-barrel domain
MKSISFGLVLVAALQAPAAHAATMLRVISLPTCLSELFGMEVKSFARRRLGAVEDLVVDLANGRVRYAILETRHRTVPVPFHALELSLENKYSLLDASPERLANAPGRAVGVDAYWDGPAPPRLARASELVGRPFRGVNGEVAGELADIVIDAHEGNVAFAVISLAAGRLHPVPLDAFAVGEELVFTLGAAKLDPARHMSRAELEAGLERSDFLRDNAAYAARLSSV